MDPHLEIVNKSWRAKPVRQKTIYKIKEGASTMYQSVKLTLHNFANSKDFIKIANKLNNIVDTNRVYKLDDIDEDELKFYSLTDKSHTILTQPMNKIFVYDNSSVHLIEPLDKANLIDDKVFYRVNVEDDDSDALVISGKHFEAPENEPRNPQDVEDKYAKYFERNDGQYNYVSLENIVPIHGNFFDAHKLDTVGFNLKYHSQEECSYQSMVNEVWGVTSDPCFRCHYDFANKTISFDFEPSDFENVRTYLMQFNGLDVEISGLNDFVWAIRFEDDYPKIMDLMAELHGQTGVDFAIKLTANV